MGKLVVDGIKGGSEKLKSTWLWILEVLEFLPWIVMDALFSGSFRGRKEVDHN